MADAVSDPAQEDDDELAAWYQRSTEDIENAKRAADAARFVDLGARARRGDDGT